MNTFDAPSLASLPPSLRSSFSHLLQRLQFLQCPLLSQLSGSGGSGGAVDLFAQGAAVGFDLLQSADDSTVQRSAAAAQLSLRLALWQWMVARYDSDLPRMFVDLAAEYADQKANQAMLAQFKRQCRHSATRAHIHNRIGLAARRVTHCLSCC